MKNKEYNNISNFKSFSINTLQSEFRKYSLEDIIDNFEPFFVKVLSDLAKERNIEADKFERLRKSDALKIVTLAPFIAKADYAMMFAYANLSILLTAANFPEIFNADENISLETRATLVLENIKDFVKDKKAFDVCKKALIAISYKDHLNDIENDRKMGKYNPLFEEKNRIKYAKKFNKILKKIQKDVRLLKIIDLNSLALNNPGFWMV
ncbi:MAG: hypothetical protein ACK4YF_03360 [Exilispira sp.]